MKKISIYRWEYRMGGCNIAFVNFQSTNLHILLLMSDFTLAFIVEGLDVLKYKEKIILE